LSVGPDLAGALDLLQRGRHAEAASALAALAAAGHTDPRLGYLRGLAALALDRDDEAFAHLQAAASVMPDHAAVLGNLGLCLTRLGRHREAIETLDRAVELAPGVADLQHNRALALLRLNRRSEAAEALRRVAELAPDRVAAWIALGECLQGLDRHEEAREAYRRAAGLAPGDAGIALRQAALAYDSNDDQGTLEAADRALALDPTLAAAWRERAGALRRLGRLDEAEQNAEQALRLAPDDPEALKARGLIHQQRDRLTLAAEDFTRAARIHHAPGRPAAASKDFLLGSRAKLRHDIEQLRHLHANGRLADAARLAELHEQALALLPAAATDGRLVELPGAVLDLLDGQYNRLHHLSEAPRLVSGALNPDLDAAAIEADYAGRGPGITWIDDLLRPEALAALRRYCLDSTFWFDFHHVNGYVGAYFSRGFGAPLLLQIAEELRERLPGIFDGQRLTQLWAYKYDSRMDGIEMHADIAAVNLNFWITPDQANLDADTGGLLVWDKEAPADWGFDEFNTSSDAGQARIRTFLADSKARMYRVPHRQNRAVLFNSDLFHRTDRIHFREGYENRRINITMLMGERGGRVR
jgi:tetratricopeptide (TPR) repeat protein